MPDSPASAIEFRDSVVLPCRFAPSFFIRASGSKGKKRWTIGLFKLQVPVEKCLSTWATRGCVRVYVKCTHRRGSPAADERPNNNKRQQENAEPRPRLRLENQAGLLSGGHLLLVFHLSVTSFLCAAFRFFFFHATDSRPKTIRYTIMRHSINCHS